MPAPFPTCPICQIGATNSTWSLTGCQVQIQGTVPPIWQFRHRTYEMLGVLNLSIVSHSHWSPLAGAVLLSDELFFVREKGPR